MITVYFLQIAPSDAQKVQKYRDLAIKWNTGVDDVSEVCLADYRKVTTVATDSLNEAWKATQHIETNWTERQTVEPGIDKNHIRSSAIGDILQRGDDYFLILGFPLGYKPFQPADVPLKSQPKTPKMPREYDVVLGGLGHSPTNDLPSTPVPPTIAPEVKALFADIKDFVENCTDFCNGNVHNGADEGEYYGIRMWNDYLRRAVKLGLIELSERQQWILHISEDE